jgi:hypothetical protein
MRTAFRPVVLISAAAAFACPAAARAQDDPHYNNPSDANNWQEQERVQRERQEQTQQQSDAWNQGQAQYQQQLQNQQQQQQQQSSGAGQSARAPASSHGSSQRAVSGNAAPALNPLAVAFQRGDYATVLKILRPKAIAGNPSAQHNLGFMYEKGYGVERNPSVAASWYEKSANQGYPDGQLALGRLYFEGVGLQRDIVEAYKWMYLAGRGTSKAFQYLDVIGKMLTYQQMTDAIRRGQAWTPVSGH